MSASTDKVLSILELLAAEPERQRVLPEVSRELSLPPASCARILSSLVRRGYAERNGRRSGYRLGPMAYALSDKGPYMGDVSLSAGCEVQKCAELVREHVLLSRRSGDKVYKIVEFEGNLEIRIRSTIMKGLYNTATGRLLLAFAGEKEIENYVKFHGLPGKAWEGCGSAGDLKRKLCDIRKRGYAEKKTETLAACAFPVKYLGEYLGLGCSMISSRFKGENKKKVMYYVKNTAEKIEKKLAERRKK